MEPPCGQLNPVKKEVVGVLEQIYSEWHDIFDFETFHLGADEVNMNCYNTSDVVTDYMAEHGIPRTEEGFIKIWSNFMNESTHAVRRAVPADKPVDYVVWTSHLTQAEYIDNISPDNYTVHIWTDGADVEDPQIKLLADKGYQMIFSNYDALYLDCGYGAWVGKGNNWCSPYKGWQKIYENDPYQLLRDRGVEVDDKVKKLVLGAEVAMWSEQVEQILKLLLLYLIKMCACMIGRFRDGGRKDISSSIRHGGEVVDEPIRVLVRR